MLKSRPMRDPVRIETRISAAIAAMKAGNVVEREKAGRAFDEVIDPGGETLPGNPTSTNTKKSSIGPNSPVTSRVALPR
jgi:hypothetical protein